MVKLEDLKIGARVKGLASGVVEVIGLQWPNPEMLEIAYKDASGKPYNQILLREQEDELELVTAEQPFSFAADAALLRLVSEAYRIKLAYLFDPLLAVNTSNLDPLPHQITAVYEEMLPKQPLRFLLADDPGAGKTIMSGLLIKELMARGDVQRCLIVAPGNLVEQWQSELKERFQLDFDPMTNEGLEASSTGNWFSEHDLAICRLDKLSRSPDLQTKLSQIEWDLIICDEAHKMSATRFGQKVKYTKRYRLGETLRDHSRHFLLLTATPHNGKEDDFQRFLALLDKDRFEGRSHGQPTDTTGLMRRLVKEQLLTFDNKPLFPERIATTADYTLSEPEMELYQAVTRYVRQEFNKVEALANNGRKGTVGFALTNLQRRLASSPLSVAESLRRRRESREKLLKKLLAAGQAANAPINPLADLPDYDDDDLDELEEDATEEELEQNEVQVLDQATTARSIGELQAEIASLKQLEMLADQLLRSRQDKKWEQLAELLQANVMYDGEGRRRKLVIFTEYRDTLTYLTERIRNLLGKPEAVVNIYGGMSREVRAKQQLDFVQDKDVYVLVATDAAGEGINLQQANLMVNYDLPWNPNRLEQRFGRIHRIGQREVCHLWNLLANQTREGEVFQLLLRKIQEQRNALGDRVFNVLGNVTFKDRPLRDLLIEAVRYGDSPEVKARLYQEVSDALDQGRVLQLVEERALVSNGLTHTKVLEIKEDMERAAARRLQPNFIGAFCLAALEHFGGRWHRREPGRCELTFVPAPIRDRARQLNSRRPVATRYERITFEKQFTHPLGQRDADLITPGHPLLNAMIKLLLDRHMDLLREGAVLIDRNDPGEEPRFLCYIEDAIQSQRVDPRTNERQSVSRQVHFVELDAQGQMRSAGYAPYLDYEPPTEDEKGVLAEVLQAEWLRGDLAGTARSHALANMVLPHLKEVKAQAEFVTTRTMAAVQQRLTREINFWDRQANELKAQELKGKVNAELNSGQARERANELERRLKKRMTELEDDRKVSVAAINVIGGVLVVPAGLIARLLGEREVAPTELFARETRRVELLAMLAVMAHEQQRGCDPHDVSAQKTGYDVESRVLGDKGQPTGLLRFIEVKGRTSGATTVTVTKNEILVGLNKPDNYILALVDVPPDAPFDENEYNERHQRRSYTMPPGCTVLYLRQPFVSPPDFAAASVNYEIKKLLEQAQIEED